MIEHLPDPPCAFGAGYMGGKCTRRTAPSYSRSPVPARLSADHSVTCGGALESRKIVDYRAAQRLPRGGGGRPGAPPTWRRRGWSECPELCCRSAYLGGGLSWCMPAALCAGRCGLMGNNNTTTNPRKIFIHSAAPGPELPSGRPRPGGPKAGGRGAKGDSE